MRVQSNQHHFGGRRWSAPLSIPLPESGYVQGTTHEPPLTRFVETEREVLRPLPSRSQGGLLGVVCDLPYRFVIPLPVQTSEVLDLSEAEWQPLDEVDMIAYDQLRTPR